MVKKLFKHEFLAYIRALLPMHLILLGIAALTRFVCFFENDSPVYNIVFTSSVIALVIACLVCLGLSFLKVITRYYKNMFTHEGYLTLTLPVTSVQHIWVKVTSGVVSILAGFVAIFLAVCVATAGELNIELIKAAFYLIGVFQKNSDGNYIYFMIEFMIMAIVALYAVTLLCYACISIGQLTNKNRVAAAIGVFCAHYFITQIISTIIIIVSHNYLIEFYDGWFWYILSYLIGARPYIDRHLSIIIPTIVIALLGWGYFAVSNHILKKKLNLE